MAEMSASEQLLLELINRARLDPAAEAGRYGTSLNSGIPPNALISTAAKQALAPNDFLKDAALAHSQHMIATDTFDHDGIGDGNPGSRIQAAGYVLTGAWTWGENIAWLGSTGPIDANAEVYNIHRNLFLSPGHRENIMGVDFRELGTGLETGRFTSGGTAYNALMATENFAATGSNIFVTGVAIADADHDNFYDIGEGRAGIHVAVSGAGGAAAGSDNTGTAGGYAAAVAPGTSFNVTFSGGDLAADVTVTVAANSKNAKVDLIDTHEVASSASITLGAGAIDVVLLGIAALRATGNDDNNRLVGNRGGNTLNGSDGADTLVGGGGRDVMTGGVGADRFDFDTISHTGKTTAGRDIITDFDTADRIDLRDADANSKSVGNQNFIWLGTGAFNGHAGQLRYVIDRAHNETIVTGDVNGDKRIDFQIELDGVHVLNKADFIL